MAGRITIRRVGSVLPTVCLLLILVVVGGVVGLSTYGFPRSWVEYGEQWAARRGIFLKVDGVRLAPERGLAVGVTGVRLYAKEGDAQPIAQAKYVAAGVNVTHLLVGEVQPSFIALLGGEARLPVTDPERTESGEAALEVKNLVLSARGGRDGVIRITSGKLEVQGVPVTLRGSINPDELGNEEEKSEENIDLSALLDEHAEWINTLYNGIESQHWTDREKPNLDLRLDLQKDLRVGVLANVPRYDKGQFHFREAAMDLDYNRHTLTINSLRFKTVQPDAAASLQGAYDTRERHLSFHMESNAALLRMVRQAAGEELQGYLSKFHHSDQHLPHVQLDGDVEFEEDFSLKSARVRGALEQKELMVGSSKVDELELSFFYDNGNFNIDKLELRLPDGKLQALASAQDGEGQTQIAADLPVQRVLTLVRELSDTEVSLPEGLILGERVKLDLHARLSAPAFIPGKKDWQDFVPSFRMVGARVQTDTLVYEDYRLKGADVGISLTGIDQDRDYQLHGVRKVEVNMQADSLRLDTGREQDVELHNAKVNLRGNDVACGDDGLPRQIGEILVDASAAELRPVSKELQESEAGGEERVVRGLHARAQALKVSLPVEGDEVRIGEGNARVTTEGAQVGDWKSGAVELQLDEVKDVTPMGEAGRRFSAARLQASAKDVQRGDWRVGDVNLSAALREYSHGRVELLVQRGEKEQPTSLRAETDWLNPQEVVVNNIDLQLPPGFLEWISDLTGTPNEEVEIPESVEAQGSCRLGSDLSLREAKWSLRARNMVRTPHKQKVFEGNRIALAVETSGEMHREKDGKNLLYKVNLHVRHETGEFRGILTGNTSGTLHVTGTNTIRPDIVDRLIDNDDAHSIIRDFRFTDKSRTHITDIAVDVDLRNGVAVDSYCLVELQDAEYMLNVMEDGPEGAEQIRRELGANQHTSVKSATCSVTAHVIMDRKLEDGSSAPDESVITIGNPVLVYDNAPWLRRNKWKTGVRETRLSGDAVVIDIERSFVELRNVRGTVYPAYSLGMFYSDLYGFLEDVIMPRPAQIETPLCVFPIYDDCTRPMSGTIRVVSRPEVGFRFLGTTIPLSEFSGFIYITDDHVQLDRMNARSWEGVLNASVKLGITGRRTSLDGYVQAQCMNLQKIAAAYGSKQAPALCCGEVRFRSPDLGITGLTGYGRVDIENGDLMQLNLFRPVSAFISDLPGHFEKLDSEARADAGQERKPGFFMRILSSLFKSLGRVVGSTGSNIGRTASNIPGMNHLIAYDLQEAHASFHIAHGFLFTRDMKAKGSNLNVRLNADLNLDTLEIRGNLWPKVSSLPTILLSPLTMLSDFMVDILIYGTLEDLKWKISLDKRMQQQNARQGEKRTPRSPTSSRETKRREGGSTPSTQ